MPTKLTVRIDPKLCIGAASCVGIAPKLFNLDEDNVAQVIDPATGEGKSTVTFEATDEELTAIKESIENCPTSAIVYIQD